MSGQQRASQTVCREHRTKTPGETCEILMSRETFKIQKQRQTDLSCRDERERQRRTGRRRGCWRAFLKKPIHHTGSRLQFSKQKGEHVCVRPYVYYVFACVCMCTHVTRRVMNGMICMEIFCHGSSAQYAAGAVHCSPVVFVVTGLCPVIKCT